jgi:hypothetical protein
MESNVRAGDLLKKARLKQRLDVAECSRRTHIAQRYVEALEDNRWHDLPSESHRQGFITLYARFLGISGDEVMALYKQEKKPLPEGSSVGGYQAQEAPAAPEPKAKPEKKPFFLPSGGQWVGILILLFVTIWGAYHLLKRNLADIQTVTWSRPHPRLLEPRLAASHPVLRQQKIKIHADAATWLRVMADKKLLFEGILPAQGEKEWSGTTPFSIKMANVSALHIFWNDQPVDIAYGARSGINSIQIPPR